jgi:Holliday junction resolvasome RuvABC DNA-binding subunit
MGYLRESEMATKKTEVVSKPKKTSKKKEENPQLPMAETFRDTYEAFKEVGFTEEQAYELLKTVMVSPALTPPRTSLF